MANIGMMFDATKVEPAGTSLQLPVSDSKGWPVVITASEMKETQAKDGSGFLELTLQIIDGEYKGVEGPYRLNIFNTNEKAQEIAHRQLSAVCHVTNTMQLTDSAMLHNKPFRAVVVPQTGEGKENYTQVKGVKDINGNDPGKAGAAPASGPTPIPTPAAATGAVTPWGTPAAAAETAAAPPWQTGGAPAGAATPTWASK